MKTSEFLVIILEFFFIFKKTKNLLSRFYLLFIHRLCLFVERLKRVMREPASTRVPASTVIGCQVERLVSISQSRPHFYLEPCQIVKEEEKEKEEEEEEMQWGPQGPNPNLFLKICCSQEKDTQKIIIILIQKNKLEELLSLYCFKYS